MSDVRFILANNAQRLMACVTLRRINATHLWELKTGDLCRYALN